MSKTIKSILLISILLFSFLQSASSQNLRRLQDAEFDLTGTEPENTAKTTDSSDGFVLDEDDTTASAPTGASTSTTEDLSSFSLGEDDEATTTNTATTATPTEANNFDLNDETVDTPPPPPPTTTENSAETLADGELFQLDDEETAPTSATTDSVGSAGQNNDETFVLGDDDETPTVTNTQNNAATTEPNFDLGDEEPVSTGSPTPQATDGDNSFELEDDDTSDSVDLSDDDDNTVGAARPTEADGETSFELEDKETDEVDLADPADEDDSTGKVSATNGGRALSSAEATITNAVKSGFSLQTGFIVSVVAVVSALLI